MSDSDIRMTTKLAGDSTFFLPFSRGNDGSAGNPPGENGSYPVSYFLQRVLQKDNWLHIFDRFVLQERKEAQGVSGKTHFKEGTHTDQVAFAVMFPRSCEPTAW